MIHLTLNQISAHIDAELPEASIELVRLHLSSCLECAERFGHIEEQEGALARLMSHSPGDPFFERFADRVLGPAKKAEPPPAGKKLEPASAAAQTHPKPVPVVARLEEPAAKLTQGPVKATEPPAKAPRPVLPARRGGARMLLPVMALLLIASAVAILVARPRIPGLTLPPIGRAATDAEPAPLVTTPMVDQGPALTPASRGSDRLERAAARSAEADRVKTAEAHDGAAAAWEEALPELSSDPDELAAGRREIASARYLAWTEGATPERRDAATRAVRAYLLCAPAGAERDRAWTWLAELKR